MIKKLKLNKMPRTIIFISPTILLNMKITRYKEEIQTINNIQKSVRNINIHSNTTCFNMQNPQEWLLL